jgi:predicted RNA-binding Zn-ribbon protein involved in translation (DUF1610 family)
VTKKLPIQNAVCTNCRTRVQAAPKVNLMGLHKFTCPNCGKPFLYPMPDRRRNWYIGFGVAFLVLFVVLLLTTRRIAFPGVIPVAAIIAVIQNASVRRKVAAAEADVANPGA